MKTKFNFRVCQTRKNEADNQQKASQSNLAISVRRDENDVIVSLDIQSEPQDVIPFLESQFPFLKLAIQRILPSDETLGYVQDLRDLWSVPYEEYPSYSDRKPHPYNQ